MLFSSKIYKFLLLIGVVSLLLFFIERIYINTMKSVKTGAIGKINAVINHDLDVNISIWGASTALANFNPLLIKDSLNVSVFNMGIDGVNIDQYNGLLEEYLNYTRKSKFLIIAIDIYGGLEKRHKFYELQNWIHHVNNDNIYNCLSDIDYNTIFKARYIPFYSTTLYNKHAFPLFRSAFFKTPPPEYQFTNLGFEPNHSEFNSNITDSNTINVPINLNVFEKLRLTCKSALTKNIKPIVVITPCFYKGLEKIKNKGEFRELIYSLKDEEIAVLDLLESSISNNVTYFKDNTHLNSKGADELSIMLIKYLQ